MVGVAQIGLAGVGDHLGLLPQNPGSAPEDMYEHVFFSIAPIKGEITSITVSYFSTSNWRATPYPGTNYVILALA